jgi:hypothetical protein
MSYHSGQQIVITDHCLIVVNAKERPAVNKQRAQRFHMEILNIKKLNDVEGKETM